MQVLVQIKSKQGISYNSGEPCTINVIANGVNVTSNIMNFLNARGLNTVLNNYFGSGNWQIVSTSYCEDGLSNLGSTVILSTSMSADSVTLRGSVSKVINGCIDDREVSTIPDIATDLSNVIAKVVQTTGADVYAVRSITYEMNSTN